MNMTVRQKAAEKKYVLSERILKNGMPLPGKGEFFICLVAWEDIMRRTAIMQNAAGKSDNNAGIYPFSPNTLI